MQEEFVFSGFGGQGVMFVGQLLAYAGMDAGLEVTWIPSYGPEMRGGTAHCFVVLADKPIGSPLVSNPKVAVVFNNPSFDKYKEIVAEGGLMVVNSSLVQRKNTRKGITVLNIPATAIADQLGNTRMTNIVLLGALLAKRPVIAMDVLRASLADHIPPHRKNMLDANYQALQRGAEFVEDLVTI